MLRAVLSANQDTHGISLSFGFGIQGLGLKVRGFQWRNSIVDAELLLLLLLLYSRTGPRRALIGCERFPLATSDVFLQSPGLMG